MEEEENGGDGEYGVMDEMGSPISSFLLNQINEERMERHRQGSRDYGELSEECLSCLVGDDWYHVSS